MNIFLSTKAGRILNVGNKSANQRNNDIGYN